jgi:hypothetical protein
MVHWDPLLEHSGQLPVDWGWPLADLPQPAEQLEHWHQQPVRLLPLALRPFWCCLSSLAG